MKLNIATLQQHASTVQEDKYVTKSVNWTVTNEDGEDEDHTGEVEVLIAGQRTWGKAKATFMGMDILKKEGKDIDPFLVNQMVLFSGDVADYDLVQSFPASLFLDLLRVIKEVNPKLFEKDDEAGKP